jgi:hypothetical protein
MNTLTRVLSITLLVLSVGAIFSPLKIFPFSNYPMFMFSKTHSEMLVILYRLENEKKIFVPSIDLLPFTRLQVGQMIYSSLKKSPDPGKRFEWIRRLLARTHTRKGLEIKSILVARAEFPLPFRGDQDIEKCKFQIIEEIERIPN